MRSRGRYAITDWQNEALGMWKEGIKPRDIAPFLLNHFPKKDFYHVHDSIRKYIESTVEYKTRKAEKQQAKQDKKAKTIETIYQTCKQPTGALGENWNQYKKKIEQTLDIKQPTGVFSDIHAPFDHPNYLQFLIDTFKQYDVGQIICLGDLVDNHAISRHQRETGAKGTYDELDMALDQLKKYIKAFPVVKVCIGNHDTRIIQQAAEVGIGERYLKSIHELLELPDTWELNEEYIIDNVLYKHGINCGGADGAINTAIQERMSTCIGHFHANAGIKYSANKRDIIFGMNVGCAIDVTAYSFAYSQHAKYRPTLGLGIVNNSGRAEFIPMSPQYFRD